MMHIVANNAHKAAQKLIDALGQLPTDIEGCARVAAACDGYDPDGEEGELYVSRFVGHCVNVACGTNGM